MWDICLNMTKNVTNLLDICIHTHTHTVKTWARDECSSRGRPRISDKDPVNGSPKEKKAFERRTNISVLIFFQGWVRGGGRWGVGGSCFKSCLRHDQTLLRVPARACMDVFSKHWNCLISINKCVNWPHSVTPCGIIIEYSGRLSDRCWWHTCVTPLEVWEKCRWAF